MGANARTFLPSDYDDQSEAISDLRKGLLSGVLIIPQHYSRDLLEQHQPHLALITDNTDRSVAGAIGEQMSTLVASINAPQVTPRLPQQALLDTVEVYPYIDYIKYLLPGSVALAIFVTAMIGGGMLFIDDKSRGLHEGYMVTPITKWELILGFNLSGVIKAVLAGETVAGVRGDRRACAGLFRAGSPHRIDLHGGAHFHRTHRNDVLHHGAHQRPAGAPRHLRRTQYAALLSERRSLSDCGLPEVAACHVGVRPVHLRRSRFPLAALEGRRHHRRKYRHFRSDIDFDHRTFRRDSAIPPDPIAMERTRTQIVCPARTGQRRPLAAGLMVLQLEDLAGGATTAGYGPGTARAEVT
ncbi:MAG: ABC transporter permease [Ignavibacteriota bacterium]